MVDLGDEVKDPLTGLKGIACWRTTYLQGCDRIGIQEPAIQKKGEESVIPKVFEVDEPQVIVVKKEE